MSNAQLTEIAALTTAIESYTRVASQRAGGLDITDYQILAYLNTALAKARAA